MRWLQWILDNPQLLVIIGGAIAYWINERRKAKENQEMAEEANREPDDAEMAERTRRIQEEIRRKIEERQGRASGLPPRLEPVPVAPAEPPPLPSLRPPVVAMETDSGAEELERVLAEQRRYAEQIERLAAAERAAAAGRSDEVAATSLTAYEHPEPAGVGRERRQGAGLGAALHDRAALRRAILLREVLGAPKALQ